MHKVLRVLFFVPESLSITSSEPTDLKAHLLVYNLVTLNFDARFVPLKRMSYTVLPFTFLFGP